VKRVTQRIGNADLILLRHLRVDRQKNCVILSELGLTQVSLRLLVRVADSRCERIIPRLVAIPWSRTVCMSGLP
jgi:hypothetical protein